MKRWLFSLLLVTLPATAQSNVAGLLYASNFATWTVPQGNQGLTSWSSPSQCTVTSGGTTFRAFSVGVPITLNDSEVPTNTEVVTPTEVAYNGFGCSISAAMTHPHKSFYFTTGTAGLGEALSFAGMQPYQVVLTPDWQRLGGTTGMITAAKGNTSVSISDQRTATIEPYLWNGSVYVQTPFSGGGSTKVVYASTIAGVTTGVTVTPGSSASGTTDSAAAINTAIAGGNVDLEVDSGFALSASLVLSSNTTIHCVAPQYGFIMQAAANAPIFANAHPEAPTTASGTGGFLVSNIVDQNIRISGCQLNFNATQAVTGNGGYSVPHMTNPATGLFITGTFFLGVQNVTVDHNEAYDSGTFALFFTNSQNIHVTDNYVHQPTPVVLLKATDGVHFIGPDQFLWVQGNRINAGDDSIAFNADDGNRPGSGDPNYDYAHGGLWTPVQWGPITDFHEDSNTLDSCLYGGRLLSATELIDRGTITNLSGTCTDYIENISDPYTGLGAGNMGNITMDNINVPVGPQTAGWGAAIPLNSTIQNLQIRGLKYANPGSANPIINHTAGTVGILSIRDWDLNTPISTFTTGIALAGGSVTSFALSGINWNDISSGSGNFVAGSAVPTAMTCSNYAGPNRLIPASGFVPTYENGDCFTNTYPAASTIYVNTTFNEHTATTLLATTTPATCTNGCTGTWTAAAGGPSAGQWAYSTSSATISGNCTSGGADDFCPVYINAGVANYTVRVNVTTLGAFGIVLRWTDNANFVTLLMNGGNATLYDVVGGTTTAIVTCTGCGGAAGLFTVVISGTSVSFTTPSGSDSGTISSSNTSDNVGINQNGVGTTVISSFSVKSN